MVAAQEGTPQRWGTWLTRSLLNVMPTKMDKSLFETPKSNRSDGEQAVARMKTKGKAVGGVESSDPVIPPSDVFLPVTSTSRQHVSAPTDPQ